MLAAFGNGEVFISMLELFAFIIWFWLLVVVFSDLFRDHSISGWGKAAWIIFLILIPYFGVFIYLIARGHGMQERAIAQQKQANADFQQYVQESGAASTPADQLKKLGELHDAGKLTDEEFAGQKAKVLAQ